MGAKTREVGVGLCGFRSCIAREALGLLIDTLGFSFNKEEEPVALLFGSEHDFPRHMDDALFRFSSCGLPPRAVFVVAPSRRSLAVVAVAVAVAVTVTDSALRCGGGKAFQIVIVQVVESFVAVLGGRSLELEIRARSSGGGGGSGEIAGFLVGGAPAADVRPESEQGTEVVEGVVEEWSACEETGGDEIHSWLYAGPDHELDGGPGGVVKGGRGEEFGKSDDGCDESAGFPG